MSRRKTTLTVYRRAGFTLVEATIAVLVVATMLVAALDMVGASAKARLLGRDQSLGLMLARQLLGEIMQCRYQDPDTETGETRATWDDVSDFNNLTENPPRDRNGAPLSGYGGWTRTVTVDLADPANPGLNSGSDLGLKRITVTMTSSTGKTVTLTGLRSSSSGYERLLSAQVTYVSDVGVTLQVGSGTMAVSNVNLVNQVP